MIVSVRAYVRVCEFLSLFIALSLCVCVYVCVVDVYVLVLFSIFKDQL